MLLASGEREPNSPLENYYHSLPHPPEKLFLISTESKRRHGVIKWIMVRRNCRLGWETSPYGFLSNYKGEADRNSSFLSSPASAKSGWSSCKPGLNLAIDLRARRERERESARECVSMLGPAFCSIHIYTVPGKVQLGISEDEKKEGTIHYVIEFMWIHGPGIRGNW